MALSYVDIRQSRSAPDPPRVPRSGQCHAVIRTVGGSSTSRFVGLDVSPKVTALCVIDNTGRRLWRGQCPSVPDAIRGVVRRRICRCPRRNGAGSTRGGFSKHFEPANHRLAGSKPISVRRRRGPSMPSGRRSSTGSIMRSDAASVGMKSPEPIAMCHLKGTTSECTRC
jgi:hypothetical protein